MIERNISVPMNKRDAYQMSVFAHMEICCNILAGLAEPKSRRHNRLLNIQAQFEPIDKTFIGYLPQGWIDASKEFELKMQEQLAALLKRFNDGETEESNVPAVPGVDIKPQVSGSKLPFAGPISSPSLANEGRGWDGDQGIRFPVRSAL